MIIDICLCVCDCVCVLFICRYLVNYPILILICCNLVLVHTSRTYINPP